MCKQLSLFPELATRVVNNIDELSLQYINNIPIPEEVNNVEAYKESMRISFEDGIKTIISDIIDLLKKYIDLHES
jgi:hypothetical protein